jgi:NitT/TauT family transport system permease protein
MALKSFQARLREHPSWLFVGVALLGLLVAITRVPGPGGESVAPPSDSSLSSLPWQLGASFLRMLVAYLGSLVFAITIGTLAATSVRRERILLPLIDILQSIPILGFFPTAIFWFMALGGHKWGVELAAVFLIFTSQSWNIVFGVFDGIKSIPSEAKEALRSLGVGPLALFRRLYLPACFTRVVDNSILSWSNGWYFLMACEIIALGPVSYRLPGIGSFLTDAISHRDWDSLAIGVAALVAVIVLLDFLVWKPLGVLALRFRFESTKSNRSVSRSGESLLSRYLNAWYFAPMRAFLAALHRLWVRAESALERPTDRGYLETAGWKIGQPLVMTVFWGALAAMAVAAVAGLLKALFMPWTVTAATLAGAVGMSFARILVAYVFCLAWILPFVYWVHRDSRSVRMVKSGSQILASIPATAFFPVITLFVLDVFHVTELAVLILLVTGMVWYLLFNVLGGAAGIPNDIREAADSLGLRGKLYVKNIFLPAIAPALVTGSVTAFGGGWNALIISEYFKQGADVHRVFGIGSILAQATYETGDSRLMALALFFMVAFIMVFNRVFWQPLYKRVEETYRLDG